MNDRYNILSVNGDLVKRQNFRISIDNRAFRYGDGLFETMHANGREVQFINDHYNRLTNCAKVLSLKLPNYFSCEYLKNTVAKLLNACRLYQGAKVRVIIVRKQGGLYLPKTNEVDIIIEAEYLSKGLYKLNDKGVLLGLFADFPKPNAPYMAYKSLNAMPYILAGQYAVQNNLDDSLLINDNGLFIEATSSNMFCVKDGVVYTPTVESGCVKGVMRKNIIPIIRNLGFEVKMVNGFTKGKLLLMDEVFLTNAVSGIKWVLGIENRRFHNYHSVKFLEALNGSVFH